MRDITFHSLCEHHLVPFFGVAHVAYIPSKNGKITGLSKIVRLVRAAAARLQLQERLTSTIADTLVESLDPEGVLVLVQAEHLCMSMRGVRAPGLAGGHLGGAGHLPHQRGHPGRGAGPDRSPAAA